MATASHDVPPSPGGVLVRPMLPDDIAAAERLSAVAYLEVDRRHTRRGEPEPAPRPAARSQAWRDRTAHLLLTDPGGCWVADVDGDVVGMAVSLRRELLWVLGSYTVRPGLQGRGIGRALLDAAATHGRGCLRAMLNSSQDARAVRRYRRAGFDLLPQMLLWGRVARADLPLVRHVREGTDADFELMDSLDRRTRGAAHGPDHALMAGQFRLLVTDRPAASGYAYVDGSGSTVALAATHRKAARSLLWEGLAGSDPGVDVRIPHVSPRNQWALDVAVAARLEVHPHGFLALRGMREPAPYVPHPTLL